MEFAWRAGEGGRGWAPQHALGGHYGAVVDMGWDAQGRCLHTVSEDQTARIFSACDAHWCEIARPQVGRWGSSMINAPLCQIQMVFSANPCAAACSAARLSAIQREGRAIVQLAWALLWAGSWVSCAHWHADTWA